MTNAPADPGPAPVGILVQPQPALGRVAVAIMQGPLMQAAVVFDAVDQLDAVIGQLVGARVATFGQPEAPAVEGAGAERTWRCKLGDDCLCGFTRDPEKCLNFQGGLSDEEA